MKITLHYDREFDFDTHFIGIQKDGERVAEGYYYLTRKEWYSDDCEIEVADTEAEFIKRIEDYFNNK